ncbi:MAG: T9SS type A sorting domain-containing protein, partial [Ignavibacterium sp.]|nr:T9SS type A sorting domain-containing protein [Ignavibacterium sp.]
TATELNNYGFDIERKVGSSQSLVNNYEKIGFVSGGGTTTIPQYYYFKDKNLTYGKYSYRLKQIDNDGQFEYSKTIEVDLGAPKKFELSQNYPNPFNPTTTISYNIPEATNVKLTIYNLLGQEIKTLVNEFKESGVHTINFDASELNSGLYIYKLQAGSFVQTRKMTLVK